MVICNYMSVPLSGCLKFNSFPIVKCLFLLVIMLVANGVIVEREGCSLEREIEPRSTTAILSWMRLAYLYVRVFNRKRLFKSFIGGLVMRSFILSNSLLTPCYVFLFFAVWFILLVRAETLVLRLWRFLMLLHDWTCVNFSYNCLMMLVSYGVC